MTTPARNWVTGAVIELVKAEAPGSPRLFPGYMCMTVEYGTPFLKPGWTMSLNYFKKFEGVLTQAVLEEAHVEVMMEAATHTAGTEQLRWICWLTKEDLEAYSAAVAAKEVVQVQAP